MELERLSTIIDGEGYVFYNCGFCLDFFDCIIMKSSPPREDNYGLMSLFWVGSDQKLDFCGNREPDYQNCMLPDGYTSMLCDNLSLMVMLS
jgi:hypothetical protein